MWNTSEQLVGNRGSRAGKALVRLQLPSRSFHHRKGAEFTWLCLAAKQRKRLDERCKKFLGWSAGILSLSCSSDGLLLQTTARQITRCLRSAGSLSSPVLLCTLHPTCAVYPALQQIDSSAAKLAGHCHSPEQHSSLQEAGLALYILDQLQWGVCLQSHRHWLGFAASQVFDSAMLVG